MGRLHQDRLPASEKRYSCASCGAHLALRTSLISKSFHGKSGPAFLFSAAVNLDVGPPESRELITGLHVVSDVFCSVCGAGAGWTYHVAHEPSQRYKEGKIILEKAKIRKERAAQDA